MKPHARRITIAAAVFGTGVLGVLVVVNWGTVRDHVEAWHFRSTCLPTTKASVVF